MYRIENNMKQELFVRNDSELITEFLYIGDYDYVG